MNPLVILGISCAAFGAAFLSGAVAFPIIAWSQTDAWTEILSVIGAVLFLWMAIRSFRVGVQVSGQKLTIRNEFRTYVIPASSIRAITLKPHSRGQELFDHWMPRVELTRGRGVWIENFDCGRASRPPKPKLAAIVEEVRALLGVGTDDLAA
jgi:hypothetical protein